MKKQAMKHRQQGEMSLFSHLNELRQRLVKVIIGLLIGIIIGMLFAERAVGLLVAPLEATGVPVIALKPTEAFAVYFKVAVVIGIVFAMPVIMYQVFQFMRPGLESNEKRYILIGAPVASLSFALGVVFAALVMIPNGLPVLAGFMDEIIEHQYGIEYYMSFVSNILIWSGLVFETPLVMYFLAILGVVSPEGFAKARRVVIVGATVGAAIVTPTTDPINMFLVMVPFLVLYELGILLARLAQRSRQARA